MVYLVLWFLWVGSSVMLPAFSFVAVMACLSSGILVLWPRARHRLRSLFYLMGPLALGFLLIHGGLFARLIGSSSTGARPLWALGLWLRILSVVSVSQIYLECFPPRRIVKSLLDGSIPSGVAYLIASPLLLSEHIGRRIGEIREAQLSRGVRVNGSVRERLSSLSALVFPLVLGLLNDLPARSAALDMKGFGRPGGDKRRDTSGFAEGETYTKGPVVSVEGLVFRSSRGEAPVVEVSALFLRSGEWILVEGGNGSGKSTLAAVLAGAVPEHRGGDLEGRAFVMGKDVRAHGCLDLSDEVQWVQQLPGLSMSGCCYSVLDEVCFGPKNLYLPADEVHRRVDEAIDLIGITHLTERNPSELSGGEAQKVALASAIAMYPRLLILDEAFSRIASSDVPVIAGGIRKWSLKNGCSVMVLERDGSAMREFCDLNGVLEGGKFVLGKSASSLNSRSRSFAGSTAKGDVLLGLREVAFSWRPEERSLFDSVDGAIRVGDRIALVGPNGAGKSTLMRLCAGLLSPGSGSIELDGLEIGAMDPELRASRVGFLFQDAERQIFHSNVADEVLFSLRNEKISAVEKKHRLEKALRETNLSGAECLHPLDLNSAERRMVAVASLAVKDLDLLLLDEPTRDFDDRWRCVFEEWLSSQRGAVIAVSHDPSFVSSFFSTVWTLKDGHLTE